MPTLQYELLRKVAHSGLAAMGLGGFRLGHDGVWRYPADRPADGWHAHGAFVAEHLDLDQGGLVALRVAKPRWLHPQTGRTVHTPPPGDLGRRYSGLVIALQLFAWLDATVGLHRFVPVFAALEDRPSRRTVQRWLAALRPRALELQHKARRAVLRRFDKPRSLDILFPGGIPPPPPRSGPWRDPDAVRQLFRGLAMVLGAGAALHLPVALLVTEAWWKVEHSPRRKR